MIIRINQLTNFGNYRQFQWGNNAPFTKCNLIYGWNYSGKTTLSRLFQILADPADLADWQGCQFEIELQGGTKLTESHLANPPRLLVTTHKLKRSQIDSEKSAAKEAIKKYYAASFCQTNNVLEKETAIQTAKEMVNKAQILLTSIEQKKLALEELKHLRHLCVDRQAA